MKRIALVLLLAVVAVGAYRFFSESACQSELEELAVILDAEVAVFLEEAWPRTPLPGEPVDGYALDWYRKAARAGREAEEALEAESGELAWSVLFTAEGAVDAWVEKAQPLPDDFLVGDPARRLRAWRTALSLAEQGTRCAEVGPRTTVAPPVDFSGNRLVRDLVDTRGMLDLSIAEAFTEGRHGDALRDALVLARMGGDVARGGVLIETWIGYTVRERGGLVIERLLASGKLREADLELACDVLRAGIRDRLPDHLEGYAEWFSIEQLFRGLGLSEVDFDELTGDVPADPLERALDWIDGDVSKREILAAWRKIREVRDRLTAAAKAGPESYAKALATDHGWSESSDTRWFAPHAGGSTPQARVLPLAQGQQGRDEARILACMSLLHRLRTGAFPADVEEIRPDDVRRAPWGGAWQLIPAREGRPASLRLVREGTVVHEIELE